ncbi:hypothetical protein ABTX15_32460 [Micromonospora sp. NPDC094482]|uniref:hypothetical protein n=1 Tax=unclassified Micromonospora TaxID=2617518 RepID=UPI0033277129
MGRLAQGWIAPPGTRELRELVRHRAKLVAVRSLCKAEVHAVLAKCGVQVPMTDLFGVAGIALLDGGGRLRRDAVETLRDFRRKLRQLNLLGSRLVLQAGIVMMAR